MKVLEKYLICCSLTGLLMSSIMEAIPLSGMVSSSGYYFTRQSRTEQGTSHLLLHESFRLKYQRRDNLTFNASGVFALDPLNSSINPFFNLYTLSVSKKNMLSLFDLKFGRLFVFDQSNSGRIDGLNLQGSFLSKTKYTVYAGGLVFSDGGFSNPMESHLLGINISWQLKDDAKLSFALSQKARSREVYTPSYYRNNFYGDYSKSIELPTVSERRLGLQLDVHRDAWSLHVATVGNIKWLNIQRFNSILTYSKGNFQKLLFEYYFRRPRIDYNSIFSVFDSQTHQQFSASTIYMVRSKYHISSKLQTTLFSDETSFLSTFGVGTDKVSVQYKFQTGYGGEFHWGTLRGQRRVLTSLTIRANLNVGNYKPLDNSWESLATIMAGISYKPTQFLTFSADVHLLKNRYYDHDTRLLIRANYFIR